MVKKSSKTLEERVSDLEKVVFGTRRKTVINKEKKYKGLAGGIKFIIDNGFFKKPNLVSEVLNELKRESYHYSIESVDKTLRDFHKRRVLTRLDEKGKWKYVLRK